MKHVYKGNGLINCYGTLNQDVYMMSLSQLCNVVDNVAISFNNSSKDISKVINVTSHCDLVRIKIFSFGKCTFK
jgi:hypothetical protein